MSQDQYDFHSLKALLTYLRDPEFGCPWDVAQTMQTIVPHTMEEVFEVIEAIETADWPGLKEELGDLLLQIVFYAQMADEAGQFNLADIVHHLVAKMVRRHPHVFPDGRLEQPTAQTRARSNVRETEQVKQAWEKIKREEAAQKSVPSQEENNDFPLANAFARVPKDLCAINRAQKLQHRAARVGLDWPEVKAVWQSLEEEIRELDAEIVAPRSDKARIADELGDVLLTCISLARHLELDASQCLRQSTRKFTARAEVVEELWYAQNHGSEMRDASPDVLHRLWQQAKQLLGSSDTNRGI